MRDNVSIDNVLIAIIFVWEIAANQHTSVIHRSKVFSQLCVITLQNPTTMVQAVHQTKKVATIPMAKFPTISAPPIGTVPGRRPLIKPGLRINAAFAPCCQAGIRCLVGTEVGASRFRSMYFFIVDCLSLGESRYQQDHERPQRDFTNTLQRMINIQLVDEHGELLTHLQDYLPSRNFRLSGRFFAPA